jgi:hypothetical protein
MPKYTIRRIILLMISAAFILALFQHRIKNFDLQSFLFLPQGVLTLLGFIDQQFLREPTDFFSFFVGMAFCIGCFFGGVLLFARLFSYFWGQTHSDMPKREVEKLVFKHGEKFQILEIGGEVYIVKL